jgi:hypothetical protein
LIPALDGGVVYVSDVQPRAPRVRKATFVTDGLAILAAWLIFGALLVALAVVVLTGGSKP